MGFFSKFEGRVEDAFENAADRVFDSPISPVQIAKKAEKEMLRQKMVGAGKQYAPTLYTVLVNPTDDTRLFGYYPTLAGETETYLAAKAAAAGLDMDGQPLVRFVVDDALKRGKFDIIAELVSRPIVEHLRAEEMHRYGLAGGSVVQEVPSRLDVNAPAPSSYPEAAAPGFIPAQDYYGGPSYNGPIVSAPIPGSEAERQQDAAFADDFHFNDANFSERPRPNQPLPYVPEEEIDRNIDYGEYTFNSQDFFDYQQSGDPAQSGASMAEALRAQAHEAAVRNAGGAASVNAAGAVLGAAGVAAGYSGAAGAGAAAGMAGAPLGGAGAGVAAAGMAAGAGAGSAAAAAASSHAPAGAVPPAEATSIIGAPSAAAYGAQVQQQAPAKQACLIDLANQQRYNLRSSRILLGRDSKSGIVLNDLNASRTHAELSRDAHGRWIIADLGSTNGTKVNGARISSVALNNGDRITIGVSNFSFRQV